MTRNSADARARQLSVAAGPAPLRPFGLALGGGALERMRLLHGGEPQLVDFHVAFHITAAVGFVSAVMFWRLPKNAGSHLSGHGVEKEAAAE